MGDLALKHRVKIMKICLLGGTGFIGKHLCKMLHNDNVKTIVVSRYPDVDFLSSHAPSIKSYSIDDPKFWMDVADVDFFVHLGSGSKPSSSWRSPEHEIEYNTLSFATTIRRLIDINPNCHVIFASSGGQIYGHGHHEPIREDDSLAQATAYGLGKLFNEQMLVFFNNIESINYTILRIANPVGYWQMGGRHGLVTAAINAGFTGERLNVYGEGSNYRDYFDVDELCGLIKILISRKENKSNIFNVGSGKGYNEIEVIDTVGACMHRKIGYKLHQSRDFDLKYSVLNVDKAKNLLNWSAKNSLEHVVDKIVKEISDRNKLMGNIQVT